MDMEQSLMDQILSDSLLVCAQSLTMHLHWSVPNQTLCSVAWKCEHFHCMVKCVEEALDWNSVPVYSIASEVTSDRFLDPLIIIMSISFQLTIPKQDNSRSTEHFSLLYSTSALSAEFWQYISARMCKPTVHASIGPKFRYSAQTNHYYSTCLGWLHVTSSLWWSNSTI